MNAERKSFDEVPLQRIEYDDTVVFAADLGPVDDASVDVVDGTIIVVAGDEQYEQDLPDGVDARAFINHGVLTIEMSDHVEDFE